MRAIVQAKLELELRAQPFYRLMQQQQGHKGRAQIVALKNDELQYTSTYEPLVFFFEGPESGCQSMSSS